MTHYVCLLFSVICCSRRPKSCSEVLQTNCNSQRYFQASHYFTCYGKDPSAGSSYNFVALWRSVGQIDWHLCSRFLCRRSTASIPIAGQVIKLCYLFSEKSALFNNTSSLYLPHFKFVSHIVQSFVQVNVTRPKEKKHFMEISLHLGL